MNALDTLDGIARNLQTPSKLTAIGGMAAEMICSHIHKGDGFEPLSPATSAYRGPGRPLMDTGAGGGLLGSITYKVVDGRTVSVGTNKPYAAIQNYGGVIRAKKQWLWIPAAGTRQLQRLYGYSPTDVLKGMKAAGYAVFRIGRTVVWREKRKTRNAEGKLQYRTHVLYYLKKSVEIPARPFFYLTDRETDLIMKEAGVAIEQL